MDFGYSPKVKELRERVDAFMQEHVFPAEATFHQQVAEGDRWQPTAIVKSSRSRPALPACGTCFCPNPTWVLA